MPERREPLPCPFCGRQGSVKRDDSHGTPGWFAGCYASLHDVPDDPRDRDCDLSPKLWDPTEEGAVERWNRRALPSADAPDVAELREQLREAKEDAAKHLQDAVNLANEVVR